MIDHRILFVADAARSSRLVEAILAASGCEVMVVPTEADVLRLLRCPAEPVALAVVDVRLGSPHEPCGASVVKGVRRISHRSDLPVIGLGSEYWQDLTTALAAGCDAYISEAFVEGELLSVVMDMLSTADAAPQRPLYKAS